MAHSSGSAIVDVLADRLQALGDTDLAGLETSTPPGLAYAGRRAATDKFWDTAKGRKWEGVRDGRNVTLWRGTKWTRICTDVRVSPQAMSDHPDSSSGQLHVKGRNGKWKGNQGTAGAVFEANSPGSAGTVRVRSGLDGVRIRRYMGGRESMGAEGDSAQLGDLILAERLLARG
jgi:hypothetical protein